MTQKSVMNISEPTPVMKTSKENMELWIEASSHKDMASNLQCCNNAIWYGLVKNI